MQRWAHSWPLSLIANLSCHRRRFSQHSTDCDQAPQRTSLLDSFEISHRKRSNWSSECVKPYHVPYWSVFGYRNDDRYLGRATQTDNTATRPAFDQECSARYRYHGPGQWDKLPTRNRSVDSRGSLISSIYQYRIGKRYHWRCQRRGELWLADQGESGILLCCQSRLRCTIQAEFRVVSIARCPSDRSTYLCELQNIRHHAARSHDAVN